MTKVLPLEARLAVAKSNQKDTGKLAEIVEIAIRMKAMVVLNLATKADIANGTRGIIHDIIMDEREETHAPREWNNKAAFSARNDSIQARPKNLHQVCRD